MTTMTTTCPHKSWSTSNERCFVDAVGHDYNPMAHGNITVTETCIRCGARRAVNVNGMHREEGGWGPSRAKREQWAREAKAAYLKLESEIAGRWRRWIHADGLVTTVSIDRQGFLAIEGPGVSSSEIQQDWPEGVAAAAKLRLAHRHMERAASYV